MTPDEREDVVRELALKLTHVVDEARREWAAEYGGTSAFHGIETGAFAHALVHSFVSLYRQVNGTRPPFDHLISSLDHYMAFLVAEAADQYGVQIVPVTSAQFDELERRARMPPGPVH